jgi:predicted Kef-type K+ transport protein
MLQAIGLPLWVLTTLFLLLVVGAIAAFAIVREFFLPKKGSVRRVERIT